MARGTAPLLAVSVYHATGIGWAPFVAAVVVIVLANEAETTIALGPFQTYDLSLDIIFEHIGIYTAGLERVVVSDFLGLFTKSVPGAEHHEANVTPQVQALEQVTFDDAATVEAPQGRALHHRRLHGLRPGARVRAGRPAQDGSLEVYRGYRSSPYAAQRLSKTSFGAAMRPYAQGAGAWAFWPSRSSTSVPATIERP